MPKKSESVRMNNQIKLPVDIVVPGSYPASLCCKPFTKPETGKYKTTKFGKPVRATSSHQHCGMVFIQQHLQIDT